MTILGMNSGTGQMTARMYMSEKGKIDADRGGRTIILG